MKLLDIIQKVEDGNISNGNGPLFFFDLRRPLGLYRAVISCRKWRGELKMFGLHLTLFKQLIHSLTSVGIIKAGGWSGPGESGLI